jgi:dienelactone hydrolase
MPLSLVRFAWSVVVRHLHRLPRLAGCGVLWLVLAATAQAQEKIQIASLAAGADGQPTRLDAYLFAPPSSAGPGPYPAVVFVHGCGGLLNKNGEILSRETAWAQYLNQQGYLVLAVDSFTTRGQSSECARNGPVTPQTVRPRDAYGALRYLQTRADVRADRIALIGWSHGGGTVLYALGPDGPAREGIAAGSAPPDFRTAIAFYPGWCNTRAQAADWRNTVPLLILMGASDVWTQPGPCQEFVDAAQARGAPVQIHLYPDAYHDFDFPAMPVREHAEFQRPGNPQTPITGTNPAARADAFERVGALLAQALKP